MCGIIAGISENIFDTLIDGLKQLQNRGYDSAGISTLNKNFFFTSKFASNNVSALKLLEKRKEGHINSNIGIGHTRWATHGAKTDANSHPHLSNNLQFCLVHNGIIENYKNLKEKLLKENFYFKSETDTEVIVNLIEYYYSLCNNVIESIEKTISVMEGTWGLVILNKLEPNKLYCTRQGSPILVSKNKNICLISSEQSGFCNKVNNYIVLKNNDICEIIKSKNNININTKNVYDSIKIKMEIKNSLNPYPYKYWTEKEIYEQVESSLRAISLGGRLLKDKVRLGGLEVLTKDIMKTQNLIILGCGTSLYAGEVGKFYFKELSNFNTVQVIDGANFSLTDIPKKGKTSLIFLSQSGETKDLHRCIEICKNIDIIKIGVVNVVDSLISREVDCGCYLNAGREVGVASTKSFTSQIILLSMISIWFSQNKKINKQKRKKYVDNLRNLSTDIQKLLEKVDVDKYINFFKTESCFILGKEKNEFIAKEGALKIKEISYIHAEGYSSSSLKHGPFALLKKDFPVIMIILEDEFLFKNMNAYEEIKSRHAKILVITDIKELNVDHKIIIPKNDLFSHILSIIPIQLLAFKLSISKGNNADMPRNLAKVVTVE